MRNFCKYKSSQYLTDFTSYKKNWVYSRILLFHDSHILNFLFKKYRSLIVCLSTHVYFLLNSIEFLFSPKASLSRKNSESFEVPEHIYNNVRGTLICSFFFILIHLSVLVIVPIAGARFFAHIIQKCSRAPITANRLTAVCTPRRRYTDSISLFICE